MTLIRVNACGPHARLHGTGEAPERAVAGLLTQDGAVIVMVHGFRYAPGTAGHCPHDHILSHDVNAAPPEAAVRTGEVPASADPQWPAALGIGKGRLGLAFGWAARGTIWQAHGEALRAAMALASVISSIRRQDPCREVHAIGHSFGARVILQALHHLPAESVNRIILLSAAEYEGPAIAALASPAGRRVSALHVTSRENLAYEVGLRGLVQSACPHDRVLGIHSTGTLPTLRLDRPEHLAALDRAGFPVAPPERRICHWSSYRRPGVFPLYRALTGENGAELHARLVRVASNPGESRHAPPLLSPTASALPRGANPS